MTDKRWSSGEATDEWEPVWEPLLTVVGPLVAWFMWMFSVRLRDGRILHAYKHRATRAYIYLDADLAAYEYQHRRGRSMYRGIDLTDALIRVTAGWGGLGNGPSPEEWALLWALIDVHDGSDLGLDDERAIASDVVVDPDAIPHVPLGP